MGFTLNHETCPVVSRLRLRSVLSLDTALSEAFISGPSLAPACSHSWLLFPCRQRSLQISCVVMCPLTTSIWSQAPRTVPLFTSSCIEGWRAVILLAKTQGRSAGGADDHFHAPDTSTLTLDGPSSVHSPRPWHTLSLCSQVFMRWLRGFSFVIFLPLISGFGWGNLTL